METIKFTAYDFKFIPQYLLNKMVELQTVNGQFIPHFITPQQDGNVSALSTSIFDNDGLDPNPVSGEFQTFCFDYAKEARDPKKAVSTLCNAQSIILLRAYEQCLEQGDDSDRFRICCNLLFHMELMYKYNIHKLVNHRELYKQFYSPVSRMRHARAMQAVFANADFMLTAVW